LATSKKQPAITAFKGYFNVTLGDQLSKDAQKTLNAYLDESAQAQWIAKALYDFTSCGVSFKLSCDADGDFVCVISTAKGAYAGYYLSSVQPTLFEVVVVSVYKWVQTARFEDSTFQTYVGRGSKYR
jgi:hypothetical protein